MSEFTSFIFEYGLTAIFIMILLEYACFPVSSEIILPFSGAVASVSHIPFFLLLFVSVAAGLIGTSLCYWAGKYGGSIMLSKLIKKFPKTEKGLNSSQNFFKRYGSTAVLFLRVIPLCRTYIAFIAGIAGQKYHSFILASFVGITVWNTLLLALGYYLQENWGNVVLYYKQYKSALFPIIFIFICFLVFQWCKKRKAKNQ